MANTKADQLITYQDSERVPSDNNGRLTSDQQLFSKKYEDDYRSSNANKSDTAHFNDGSVVQNQDMSARISTYPSEEKVIDE